MELTVNIKYKIGDKVWRMSENYPQRYTIEKIIVSGGIIDKEGAEDSIGQVKYVLNDDNYAKYSEDQLYDTFDQLRDYVFSDDLRDQ